MGVCHYVCVFLLVWHLTKRGGGRKEEEPQPMECSQHKNILKQPCHVLMSKRSVSHLGSLVKKKCGQLMGGNCGSLAKNS